MLQYWSQHDGLVVCRIVPAPDAGTVRRLEQFRWVALEEGGLYCSSGLALVEEVKYLRSSP